MQKRRPRPDKSTLKILVVIPFAAALSSARFAVQSSAWSKSIWFFGLFGFQKFPRVARVGYVAPCCLNEQKTFLEPPGLILLSSSATVQSGLRTVGAR